MELLNQAVSFYCSLPLLIAETKRPNKSRLSFTHPSTRFSASQFATSHYFDINKARLHFDYKPKIENEEGIKQWWTGFLRILSVDSISGFSANGAAIPFELAALFLRLLSSLNRSHGGLRSAPGFWFYRSSFNQFNQSIHDRFSISNLRAIFA